MEVRSFEMEIAPIVARWPTSAAESIAWCSEPDVVAATFGAWVAGPGVEAYAAFVGDTPVAYGELWVDDAEVELAHLIVAPGERGAGVGRRFVRALADTAAQRRSMVALRVAAENEPAIRCYAAAGFTRAAPDDEAAWNTGQPRPYVWMINGEQSTRDCGAAP